MCSERSGMFFWFYRYLELSDLIQSRWYMGLCLQAHSVHESYLLCSGWIMCSNRSCRFSWFYRYIDFSYLTQFGLAKVPCTQAHSAHASTLACMLRLYYVLTGPACSHHSVDTLTFLIQPNLAEIWAYACKHIGCMHGSFHAQVK